MKQFLFVISFFTIYNSLLAQKLIKEKVYTYKNVITIKVPDNIPLPDSIKKYLEIPKVTYFDVYSYENKIRAAKNYDKQANAHFFDFVTDTKTYQYYNIDSAKSKYTITSNRINIDIDLQPTGRTKNMLGHPCNEFVYNNKALLDTLWIATDLKGTVVPDYALCIDKGVVLECKYENGEQHTIIEKIEEKEFNTNLFTRPENFQEVPVKDLYALYKINRKDAYPLLNLKLPAFRGKDLSGKEINTNNMTGQVLVINTWFVGCMPCAAEMPELNKLVKKYEKQNVSFIAPCLTDSDKIKEFLLKKNFDYKIIPNSKEYCEKILKCTGYPNNIVVNKKGEIVYFSSGYDDKIGTYLERVINKALKE